MTKQDVENYKPSFIRYSKKGQEVVCYETSFYCNENKIIHKNKSEVLKCKKCMSNIS